MDKVELEEKELSNVSDEDFADLGSSSESSEDDMEEDSSEDESEYSTKGSYKKKDNKKPIKKAKKISKPRIIMNVSDTQYDVVKYVGKKIFGWKLSYEEETLDWDMFWTDNAVQPETLAKMQTFQKINHFPGMYSLARKNHLGRNLMRMKKAFPNEFKFFPQTFLLPSEYNDFKMQFNKKKNKTFIAKPEASCQGRGIFLTRTWESIQPGEHYVVQRYLHKPYLIDGLKFDMRIYVLLAGCDPLKIFLFDDGLGRFATEEYVVPNAENLEDVCMHLTNYAINKDNPNFVFNESSGADDVGHKRSLKAVFRTLQEQGHDVDALWKEIRKIIIKTFCSVQPILAHNYKSCHPDEPYNNMCFEILGFDIMLDHKLKPWLIEVNHTPSFTTDTPLDKSIKKHAIRDALKLMNISIDNTIKAKNKKRAELQQRVLTGKKVKITPEEKQIAFEKAQKEREVWEAKNCGRYKKIYPFDDPAEAEEDYEEFMKVAHKWWEEWTGTSIKRNIKKSTDPNKPPPMIFGQGPAAANRAKEIHNIYSQKLKPVYGKPPSAQNSRSLAPNGNSTDTQSQDNKLGVRVPNRLDKVAQLDDNDNPTDFTEDQKDYDEENRDFINHVALLTGNEETDITAEDQGDNYNGPERVPRRNFTVKNMDFRIKSINSTKDSPQKLVSEKNSNEDQKFHFSRKFAHYLSADKGDDTQVANGMTVGTKMKGEKNYEKDISTKKVPLKLSNGILGIFDAGTDQWPKAGGIIYNTTPDIERETKPGSNPLTGMNKNSAKNEKYIGKKSAAAPMYPQFKMVPGNYVAPKLLELNLNIGQKEEFSLKQANNNVGGFSLQGCGVGIKGTGRGPIYQRESNSNINYYGDPQTNMQKFYNFVNSKKY